MRLYLDNIVFSLQKAGGVSVVYYELLKRILDQEREFEELKFFDYPNDNIFRKILKIPPNFIINRNSARIARYFNPIINSKDRIIFHSSYYRICEKTNILNVTTVHDFIYEFYMKGLFSKIHEYQKWKAIRNSDAIICVSENTKKDLINFLPDIETKKIHVIHNGVSEDFKVLNEKHVPEKFKILTNVPYILYVGARHVTHKNFDIVAHALSELYDFKLVLIGGNEISEKEKKLFEDLNISNRIIHFSGMSSEDLNLVYNLAYCFIYPSLYEGFGIPILEAQRAGCPVIALNSSSIPEIAGDGALLFSNNSIDELISKIKSLDDFFLKDTIIEKGLNNSKKFSWDKTFNAIFQLYKQIY